MNVPRAERPYTDFYPVLDVNAPIKINLTRSAGPPKKSGVPVSDGAANEAPAEALPTVPEPRASTFGVADYIGGRGNSFRYLPLEHRPHVPPPVIRNPKVLDADVGFVEPTKHFESTERRHPDPQIEASQLISRLEPESDLDLINQVANLDVVEYNIDETDLGMLSYIRMRYGQLIDAEEFEVAASMLDLAAALISLKMLPKRRNSSRQQEDHRRCEICDSDASSDLDTIVFCDGCDIAVHQDCYGVPSIPEGRWLCRRCQIAGIGADVECILCPHKHGAFKQTTKGQWIHLVCALWTPVVRVPDNTNLMEPIYDSELIDKQRYTLVCCVCRIKHGTCVQCPVQGCFRSFHVTCAKYSGFYMTNCNREIEQLLQQQHFLSIYCHKHSLPYLEGKPAPNMEVARAMLRESPGSGSDVSLFEARKHPYWRTANGTLILPKIVVDAVQQGLRKRIDLDLPREVVEFLCRYWTVKKDTAGMMFEPRLALALELAQFHDFSAKDGALEGSQDPRKIVEELLRFMENRERRKQRHK